MTDLIDPNSTEFSDLLSQWYEAQEQLSAIKAREMMLRKQIFDSQFPDPVPGKGNKVRLPHNMGLIGDYKLNYKIDQPVMLATKASIDPILFDDVISFSPSVRDAKFREMTDEQRRPFTGFITVSPGAPALEIKPADKIRW